MEEFSPQLNINLIEELIRYDEVELALKVFDMLPAHLRDNIPPELKKLKENILSSLCTPHAYLNSDLDSDVTKEKAIFVMDNTLRGLLIKKEMEKYRDLDFYPHIVDMGPGEYFIPIALQELKHAFTYKPIMFDKSAHKEWRKVSIPPPTSRTSEMPLYQQPVIFIACEIIEHLFHVEDIAIECLRHCGELPEKIHLSTPKYAYDASNKDWIKPCGLPHLRTYTPKEFIHAAIDLFPDYVWQLYDSQILSLRGVRNDIIDKEPLI